MGGQIAGQVHARRRHFRAARAKESGGERSGQRLCVVGDLKLGGRHRHGQLPDEAGGVGVPAGVAGDEHDAGAFHYFNSALTLRRNSAALKGRRGAASPLRKLAAMAENWRARLGGGRKTDHWPLCKLEKASGMGKPSARVWLSHLYWTKKASQMPSATPMAAAPAKRGQAGAWVQILNCFFPVVARSQTSNASTGRIMMRPPMCFFHVVAGADWIWRVISRARSRARLAVAPLTFGVRCD